MNPPCKLCGAPLLRWAWYEAVGEPVEYWYCLECDRADREPCIQIHPKRKESVMKDSAELMSIFAEFERQIDDLRELIYTEIRRVNEENARLLLRLDQMERQRLDSAVMRQKASPNPYSR